MTRPNRVAVLALTSIVLMSAMGVVYTSYLNRKQFAQLERLHAERDSLEVEWGRLLLEQGTLATPTRIEQEARKRLKMKVPAAERMVVIKP